MGSQAYLLLLLWSMSASCLGEPVNGTDIHKPVRGAVSMQDEVVPNNRKHHIAFRDMFMEKMASRIFDRFMAKVRYSSWRGHQVLTDPTYLRKEMDVKKKSSIYDIQISADHLMVHGFHDLKLSFIRVIRHYGLRDLKVLLHVGADIKISGHYSLKGEALSFLPVTGDGNFIISLDSCSLSTIIFLTLADDRHDGDKVVLKDLEVAVDYEKVRLDFKNLMGGGVVGSTANMVINAVGDAIIDSQRNEIITLVKQTLKDLVYLSF